MDVESKPKLSQEVDASQEVEAKSKLVEAWPDFDQGRPVVRKVWKDPSKGLMTTTTIFFSEDEVAYELRWLKDTVPGLSILEGPAEIGLGLEGALDVDVGALALRHRHPAGALLHDVGELVAEHRQS